MIRSNLSLEYDLGRCLRAIPLQEGQVKQGTTQIGGRAINHFLKETIKVSFLDCVKLVYITYFQPRFHGPGHLDVGGIIPPEFYQYRPLLVL